MQKYNFLEAEKKWQDYWKQEGIYKFDKNSNKPTFSIDTPPPTVNGKIHIGHIFSYTQTEIIARYKRMNGYNVFYPFGFDDNGLPTERLVEKSSGKRAHEYTREEFTNLCLRETKELEEKFRHLFISAGFSVDWNYEYSTISPDAQKTSQKSFLDILKKGKVYYAEAPAIWCHECGTAIAQAELETVEQASTFNYMNFKIVDSSDTLQIATTRPELLPACVCVFVNPNDQKNKKYIGKKVIVPVTNVVVPILADEGVDITKGTGIVMCCTFGDLTDLEWFKKYKFQYIQAILPEGRMSDICGKYAGLTIKQARTMIIQDMLENKIIYKQEEIKHNVATHERCGTSMEIMLKKQWFIKILENKEKFLAQGDKINWYPTHMKVRYTNWVENIAWDWCISRQRYFGVPFPVWYCRDCGEIIVPGEKDLPVNPLSSLPKSACPKCGGKNFEPEKDIMDTWATSSLTPLICTKYVKDPELSRKLMPMSLRPNAHDIIRTWDFYTIVKQFYHFNEIPWQNVMISGFVMANKDEKISKRKDNSKMEPNFVINNYSADVTRYWAANGSLGTDIIFSEDEFKGGTKLINKLFNASNFVLMHLQDYNNTMPDNLLPIDKFIIAKYNDVLKKYNNYLEKFEIGLALNEIEKFFWSFCDNYIEIVKNRLYKPEIYGYKERESGQYACYNVLLGILKCFAPYMPHITEEVYKDYFEKFENSKSIHITKIQNIEVAFEKNILSQGEVFLDILSLIRRYKTEHNFSMKEPLNTVTIKAPEIDFIKKAEIDLKATCSISNLQYEVADNINVQIM
ncbi:MAG: valine--tRNA ligase [Clostridia bacterium]